MEWNTSPGREAEVKWKNRRERKKYKKKIVYFSSSSFSCIFPYNLQLEHSSALWKRVVSSAKIKNCFAHAVSHTKKKSYISTNSSLWFFPAHFYDFWDTKKKQMKKKNNQRYKIAVKKRRNKRIKKNFHDFKSLLLLGCVRGVWTCFLWKCDSHTNWTVKFNRVFFFTVIHTPFTTNPILFVYRCDFCVHFKN